MLSGLPTGFEARAVAEETRCYRTRFKLAEALLAAPEGLRYVARTLLAEPTDLHALAREVDAQPGRRSGPRVCCVGEPVGARAGHVDREAATSDERLRASTAVVVDLGDRWLGIVTDRDLRVKVVAAGVPGRCPRSAR